MPFLLLASQAWALGLGEIRLSSALNEPMRAEIELIAATPEELDNLTIALASEETFSRYDLDRPLFLTRLQFEMVRSGRADGNVIRVTSIAPITEPFVTFLVEASWSRGRLLREYTILLDPPTFAPPPAAQSTQAVTAPTRVTPSDSGQIQRQPAPQPQAAPAPSRAPVQAPVQSSSNQPVQQQPTPTPTPTQGQPTFDDSPGGDLLVVRGDTLWGITNRVRPDSRLTINQTMLAIFEANPEAFADNINVLRAGATLRIPSADDVFRISRGDAFAEVVRQNAAWGGLPGVADISPAEAQPSLTLVPPDEDDAIDLSDDFVDTGVADLIDDTVDDVIADPVEARISEIEDILVDQDALIEIPDNELAALRAELAELRGEEPPIEDTIDDELLIDDAEIVVDDVVADPPVPRVITTPARDDGILDKILGYASNFWVWVVGALILTVLILVWFMRRAANRDDEDATGVWDALDGDELDSDSMASTERLRALAQADSESIVVVETEQQPGNDELFGIDTMQAPAVEEHQAPEPAAEPSPAAALGDTGTNKSLEDTFSSETAINLDQSDPVAEADFHMAYGLYDQAADLINGALTAEPDRQDLLSKLCEIYFVWGNRDAFVDAAGRLKTAVGGDSNPDWDKTVIMGQQIAGEHELFSGVSAEGATKAVDLSFDDGSDEAGELDIDFADGPEEGGSDIIDLGEEVGDGVSLTDTGQVSISPGHGTAIDFSVDGPDIDASSTREMPQSAADSNAADETAEMPATDVSAEDIFADAAEGTAESPTIEQQFQMEATGELPSLTESDIAIPETDATAEINLDDLGLDIGDLGETAVATNIDPISDLEDTAASQTLKIDDLDVTGTNAAVEEEELDATSRNPTLSDDDATQMASLDDDDYDTGEDTDVGIDTSLLDATGQTQILTEDMAVSTGTNLDVKVSSDDATMLAPLDDDDDGEFDFAKTEALPKDVFSPNMATDETGRMPNLAGSTDMDLDLDDLTAALKVSEVGDTINQMRDDATVEQPRIKPADAANGDDTSETGVTQALAPEDLSGDLHEARTMTEVGTKLDLARAYVDMGDPGGARSILEEVLDEGDQGQKQQAQQLLDSLPT
jgi:pilus assembly protein FimV